MTILKMPPKKLYEKMVYVEDNVEFSLNFPQRYFRNHLTTNELAFPENHNASIKMRNQLEVLALTQGRCLNYHEIRRLDYIEQKKLDSLKRKSSFRRPYEKLFHGNGSTHYHRNNTDRI